MVKTREGGCSRTRPFFVSTKTMKGTKGTKGVLQVVAVIALLAATACSSKPPLANSYSSADALAAAILEALGAGDRIRLEALALNEQEFSDHVWPDLPAARPERNLPLSYVWGDLQQKSQVALSTSLKEHSGRLYQLRQISFAGMTDYAHYRVHRGARFRVVDSAGRETETRLCGSFIEKDGSWKVFSYVVD